MRIGYAISSIEIIKELNKVRSTYNIDSIKQKMIELTFENWGYFEKNINKIIEIWEYTYNELIKLGFIIPKSSTNFLFIEIPNSFKYTAKEYYLNLKKNNILVRYFGNEDKLRISIGNKEEMKILINVIKKELLWIK